MSLAEIVAWALFTVFIGWLAVVLWATMRTVREEARRDAVRRGSG